MTRWILFAVALISLPIVTDALCDYQFRHPDQTQSSLDRLIDGINGKDTANKLHRILSGSDEQAAMKELWGSQ